MIRHFLPGLISKFDGCILMHSVNKAASILTNGKACKIPQNSYVSIFYLNWSESYGSQKKTNVLCA